MTITEPPAADTLRAGRYRDARAVLDAAEANPRLPFPTIGRDVARFWLSATVGEDWQTAARVLAETGDCLTAALGVEFRHMPGHSAGPNYHVLVAAMPGGLNVEIHAWAKALGTIEANIAARLEVLHAEVAAMSPRSAA